MAYPIPWGWQKKPTPQLFLINRHSFVHINLAILDSLYQGRTLMLCCMTKRKVIRLQIALDTITEIAPACTARYCRCYVMRDLLMLFDRRRSCGDGLAPNTWSRRHRWIAVPASHSLWSTDALNRISASNSETKHLAVKRSNDTDMIAA